VSTSIVQEEFIENSITLAGKVQDQFTDKLGKKSRGVKQAPYMVLHKAYMPRTLIEMGFISNPEDGAFLDSDDGQDQLARAIADAIISYKKEYFGNGGIEQEPAVKPSQRIEPAVASSGPDTDSDSIIEKPVVKTPVKTAAKPETPKPQPQTQTTVTAADSGADNVVFKVQLAVSSSKLDLTPANFNGLANLSVMSAGGLYKYMYGQTGDYEEARRLQAEAKSKGYAQAFVIAFRDGKKISVREALDKR
jgi:N-acetylmuramoyl-L-alanine amidase